MSYQLTVTPLTAPLFKKVFLEQLNGMEAEIEAKTNEITLLRAAKTEIEKELKNLEAMVAFNGIGDYDQGATIIDKIKYVLRNSEDPLTSREISERLIAIDKRLAENKTTTIKNVSTLLSVYKSEENGDGKPFKRIVRDKQDNVFTLN